MMKISIFIEFGALTCGLGMLVGGFFGMNLTSTLEDTPYVWITTVLLSLVSMVLAMAWFTRVTLRLLHLIS